MIRILILAVFFIGSCKSSYVLAQQRIAAAPAYLQLTGETQEGAEVTASSKQLTIMYDPGMARGELQINRLKSINEDVLDLIGRAAGEVVTFTISIPEGKFAFGNSMNERFSAQGEIIVNGENSTFTVDFDVSNMKDNRSNSFKVIGQGKLSFNEQFGLTDIPFKDSFAFYFNQNLTLFKP
jgi:hypothetical protein